ncbi:MAG: hypothetical protein ABIF10_03085 [Candidatus Woesearchaeota archaeon]
MSDLVYIVNGSLKVDTAFIRSVLDGISIFRPLKVGEIENSPLMVKYALQSTYEQDKKQVNIISLTQKLNEMGFNRVKAGKLVVTDADLYGGGANNWCFGGLVPTNRGLGYSIISTTRLDNPSMVRLVFHHEAGHMFGAPSEGRRNTYEQLGRHCTNKLCTMNQFMSVAEAKRLATAIEQSRTSQYCGLCQEDIANYSPP